MTRGWLLVVPTLTLAASAVAAPATPWLGEEMPLPLAVKTPQDLTFKAEAERQYLIFNLMASGKVAFETGDHARAVKKWDALLRIPNLPAEVDRAVRPLLAEARRLANDPGAAPPPRVAETPSTAPTAVSTRPVAPRVTVSGSVSGGGAVGPGAAVLWLKRTDGPTPLPRPGRPRVISQRDKTFVPRVLAVPMGTKVDFKNDDPFFHNVFSLSPARKFDTGLYASGLSYAETFDKPGPVELLCNIHETMMGYLYVVDTPWFAQPRTNGSFTIRNVPPGTYELHAWHESSQRVVKQPLRVPADGVQGIAVKIPGDRPPLVVVPDKYGRPRQPQLGY